MPHANSSRFQAEFSQETREFAQLLEAVRVSPVCECEGVSVCVCARTGQFVRSLWAACGPQTNSNDPEVCLVLSHTEVTGRGTLCTLSTK